MSYRALIAFAPIASIERVNDPAWKQPDRPMYGALTFRPGQACVPLLINHDSTRVVGTVTAISRFEMPDGGWFVAHATIDDAPSWLSKHTKASFAFASVGTSHNFGVEIVRRGVINEVSLISPDKRPAEPLTRLLVLRETTDAALEPQRIFRPHSGVILGTR